MKKVMMGVVMMGVVMMVLTVAAQAQNDVIAKFFNKYDGDESFSKVSISGKMFSMMANIDGNTEDEKAMISAISKIKGLKILKKDDARNSRELYKEALSMVPIGQFEELMTVRDKDKDMKFFTKESGGKISELVMVLGGNEEFLVMSLFGEIDLKEMGKIGKSVNIDGLQNLDKMKDKAKDKKKD
ncbi:MAG: DUF4252 domain-containing protein [Cyclobacteriaceae bacterium]|nr:DUF4252 domain-containing protein [Cyclobacteriaceae bacterium]